MGKQGLNDSVKFQYVNTATAFQNVFNSFATQNTTSTWLLKACDHSVAKCVAFGNSHKSTPSSYSDIDMATLSFALTNTNSVSVDTVDQSNMLSTQSNGMSTSFDEFSLTPPTFVYGPNKSQPKRLFKFEWYQQWQTLISNLYHNYQINF